MRILQVILILLLVTIPIQAQEYRTVVPDEATLEIVTDYPDEEDEFHEAGDDEGYYPHQPVPDHPQQPQPEPVEPPSSEPQPEPEPARPDTGSIRAWGTMGRLDRARCSHCGERGRAALLWRYVLIQGSSPGATLGDYRAGATIRKQGEDLLNRLGENPGPDLADNAELVVDRMLDPLHPQSRGSAWDCACGARFLVTVKPDWLVPFCRLCGGRARPVAEAELSSLQVERAQYLACVTYCFACRRFGQTEVSADPNVNVGMLPGLEEFGRLSSDAIIRCSRCRAFLRPGSMVPILRDEKKVCLCPYCLEPYTAETEADVLRNQTRSYPPPGSNYERRDPKELVESFNPVVPVDSFRRWVRERKVDNPMILGNMMLNHSVGRFDPDGNPRVIPKK